MRCHEASAAAPSDDRGEQDSLSLRERRAREEDDSGSQTPAAPVAQPERREQRGDDEEDVHEHVGLRRQQPLAEPRRDEHGEERRPESPGRRVTVEAAGDRRDRADDEEPELEMEA